MEFRVVFFFKVEVSDEVSINHQGCVKYSSKYDIPHQKIKRYINDRKRSLTARNFFKSLPEAISCRTANPRLISILNPDATSRTHFSGSKTSGILGGDLVQRKLKPTPLERIYIAKAEANTFRKNIHLPKLKGCKEYQTILTCLRSWMHWTTGKEQPERISINGKLKLLSDIQAIQKKSRQQLHHQAHQQRFSCSSIGKHQQLQKQNQNH